MYGRGCEIVSYFTLVLAILGIVFGVKGRKMATPETKGLATAGFVLGIIGVCFAVIGVLRHLRSWHAGCYGRCRIRDLSICAIRSSWGTYSIFLRKGGCHDTAI